MRAEGYALFWSLDHSDRRVTVQVRPLTAGRPPEQWTGVVSF
ncbi:MAG: hypothetical protein DIU72_010365 [Pseudomonadota bacterium]